MEDVEITDSFFKDLLYGLGCIGCYMFLFIWVTVIFFIKPPEDIDPSLLPLLLSIIWISVGLSFFCFYGILKGYTKPRRFLISTRNIIFKTPYKPYFEIKWSEIDKIHINTLKISDSTLYGPSTHFEFSFIKGESIRVYDLITNKDFHKKKIIPKILRNIKKFTLSMDKELRFLTIDKGFASKMFHEIGFSN